MSAGVVALIVLGCVAVLAAGGYFAYQYRLRGIMQQEVGADAAAAAASLLAAGQGYYARSLLLPPPFTSVLFSPDRCVP